MLTKEQKQTVLSLIDRGEWKHSWHLPMKSYGIDWSNPKTLDKCIAVLVEMRNDAIRVIQRIESVDTLLVNELTNINERIREEEEYENHSQETGRD